MLEEELRLIGEYGLRNKRELWLARTILRELKHRARSLLSMPAEQRAKLEAEFKARLFKAGSYRSRTYHSMPCYRWMLGQYWIGDYRQ